MAKIELPDFLEPTTEQVKVTSGIVFGEPDDGRLVSRGQLKRLFYNQIIVQPDLDVWGRPVKRFVARAMLPESNSGGDEPTPIQVFVPEPGDDYDLVMSLCTDGQHRFLLDWDAGCMGWEPRSGDIIVPSSRNFHVYNSEPIDYDHLMRKHTAIGNVGYRDMNRHKATCGLRPPWKSKRGSFGTDSSVVTNRECYMNFKWEDVDDVEDSGSGVTLDELFT